MDDGTDPFGSHTDQPEAVHWDTDEWRAEMRERYRSTDETND